MPPPSLVVSGALHAVGAPEQLVIEKLPSRDMCSKTVRNRAGAAKRLQHRDPSTLPPSISLNDARSKVVTKDDGNFGKTRNSLNRFAFGRPDPT